MRRVRDALNKEGGVVTFGIGMIGYGMIGRVHTLGYRALPIMYPHQLPSIHLAAVCTSREETARAALMRGSPVGTPTRRVFWSSRMSVWWIAWRPMIYIVPWSWRRSPLASTSTARSHWP